MEKKILRNSILRAVAAIVCSGCLTGCIEETQPASSYLTADQVNNSPTATAGLANAISGKFSQAETYGSMEYDLGYSGLCLIRDIMGEDMSLNAGGYDYFSYWGADTYLGENWSTAYFPWTWYYQLVNNCNQLLGVVTNVTADNKQYVGMAHFYRAWAYFDMAQMYEYKKTGIAELDNEADAKDIWGLTVPKITETTTEEEARNTPRMPFYDAYKFILDDLNMAETQLTGIQRSSKNTPDIYCVYGEKARVYLDMATRFRLHPDMLTKYIASGIDLGVTTTDDCYNKAKDYAEKAINSHSQYTPLTQDEWYGGGTTGFNTVSASSWMLGAILSSENLSSSSWRNFIGHISPEQTYGVGGIAYNEQTQTYSNQYQAQRTINKALYNQIASNDWRKLTFLSPDDAGKVNTKYITTIPNAMFQKIPAYASFKFRPKSGGMTVASVGAAADFPLMRVEEMIFIDIEAKLFADGLTEAQSALNNFMSRYRTSNNSYTCSATTEEEMLTEMLLQKRIEFWGEGITYWDYKRLELGVIRGYTGTNYPVSYRYNSESNTQGKYFIPANYNFYIPKTELGLNAAMADKGNPDPSSKMTFWSE